MNGLKSLFHWLRHRMDSLLFTLCRNEVLWLAVPLARLSRMVFLREFVNRKVNYRDVAELSRIVRAAIAEAPTAHRRDSVAIPPELRVLMVFPAYVNEAYVGTAQRTIETNFASVWVATARSAGLIVETFHSDAVSYVPADASNAKVLAEEEERLLAKVREFAPDLIFMDTNYAANSNTINRSTVARIRATRECKIAGHVGDAYSVAALRIIEYWASAIDIVFYGEPGMPPMGLPNVHYVHYFANESIFYPSTQKRYVLTFSGSGNTARYVYLAAAKAVAKRRGYDCQINVHNYSVASALTADEYSRLMRESRAVLNLSARTAPGVRVVTGRVQEAIASKALLLEEKNESLSRIFTPFAHYIPFDSIDELAIAMDFSVTQSKLVEKIIEAAYAKYNAEHSGRHVWPEMLRLCNLDVDAGDQA